MGTVRHSSHWGAFSAEVRDGRVVGVTPFEADPNPSPILQAMPEALYHDCRVAEPMIRKSWLENGPGSNREARGGEPFVAVPWDRALDLVSDELARIKQEHGNAAIFGGSYGWASAGRFHHAKTQLQRFLNCHGGFTAQVHSYSIAAGLAILPHILGDLQSLRSVSSWRDIAENSGMLVSFGGVGTKNAQVEPGGSGEHSTDKWLRQLRTAGVKVVNVTPLRDDTPDYLDAQWIAPRPNTDVALMLGLAHTLVAENRHEPDFLARYCAGFERFKQYLTGESDGQPKDAAWAAAITTIDADTIRELARAMASNRTMITTSYSLQRGDHGEQTWWMTAVLAAILGQVGLPGGGFGFGYGSMQGQGNPIDPITAPNLSAGANPTGSFIPVARIADMLLDPGGHYDFNGRKRTYPDTRMIYWCGGNPFHHHQDINRLVQAFRQPETIIVHEPWWTATARHADIVLPATTTLERNDIGSSSRDRFILAMEQAVEPVGEARNDFDIFSSLAQRLGFHDAYTEGRDESEWLRHLYEVARQQTAQNRIELPDFESFWADGYVERPESEQPHVVFADFRAEPNANPLQTPSGKIEIFSETIDGFGYDDCPGHPVWLEPVEWLGATAAKRFPLHLMSNQPATRLHAQMDCASVSRDAKIKGREPIALNPEDAAARGIEDGDIVRVFNDRGETLAGVILSEAVRPGVVRLATGAWYDPTEPGRVGTLDKHGNPNVLTIDRGTSKLGQGPISHSTLVEVERFERDLPDITAFTGPVASKVSS
ncbi:MAG: molybdopterin guanine dinucleotide-containing S/N-oxide reductase [Alphaproteobacteria bacterium]|nr:molybdopterin guanine dinucleotide-containing S/N-oxide reductase [Alphaproteobacteria bacterium]